METQLTQAPPAPTPTPDQVPPSPALARPLRVAIVEDSPLIRTHLDEALGELPNVVVAGHAESEGAARALLAPGDWDLVILDLQLQKGNGLNVLRSLQAVPAHKRGHVAVFTNYAFPQYRDRSLALGADYFFDKARDLPRVLDLVATLANPHRGPLS